MAIAHRWNVLWLILASCLAVAGCRATVAVPRAAPEINLVEQGKSSASAFFRDPMLSHVSLSPNGEYIAAIYARGGTEMLVVRPTVGGEIQPLAKLERNQRDASQSIRTVDWGSDTRIVVSIEMPSTNPGAVGIRARQSRLLLVDRVTGHSRYLGAKWPYQEYSQSQDDIISYLPDDPNSILLGWWQPDQDGKSVKRVSLATGQLRSLVTHRKDVEWWRADHRGQVRAGGGQVTRSTVKFLYARSDPDERFVEIQRRDPFSEPGFQFLAFSDDPNVLYVVSDDETGRDTIYTYDLAKREMGPMVYGHPEVDVNRIVVSTRDGRPLAVPYITDRPRLHFLDEARKREQAAIDRALPGTINRIVQTDRSERLALLHVSSDTVPPTYYLFDREKKELRPLFEAYPELAEMELAAMEPVSFQTRDGLTIHGYLTIPPGAKRQNLPTIVFPHGGPWVRDVWGWNATVQFLASRGFAVFQMNFRGSTGYGTAHTVAGYGQWGLAMQDDITDGTKWLIERGVADPDRIGIFGISYGGYTSLQALVKTPELFKAGASYAGVTDLITLLNDDEGYRGFKQSMAKYVGDKRKDRAYLTSASPARHAGKIRVPVLIGHGTEDWRIHVRQAHRMIDELNSAGGDVEAYIYKDEIHGFHDERNRIDFYAKLARFFERHLAPQADEGGEVASAP